MTSPPLSLLRKRKPAKALTRWLMLGMAGALLCLMLASPLFDPASAQPGVLQQNYPIEMLQDEHNVFLKFDLHDPRIRPIVLLPNNDTGGLEPLQTIKNRLYIYEQWAIINADLFSHGCPQGVYCMQGLTYVFGEHKPIWDDYDQIYTIRGNIGFDQENHVEINVHQKQSKRYMTIGGGPRVLIGGVPTCAGELRGNKTFFPASGEWFDDDARWWCKDTRAISLVGHSADKRYLYMGLSLGDQTVLEAAQWLRDRGAFEVLRLDSGGSSKMYFNDHYFSGKGSIEGRPVASAFAMVFDPSFAPAPPTPEPAEPQPNAAPSPLYPANGAILTSRTVTFQWDDAPSNRPRFVLRVEDISHDVADEDFVVLQERIASNQHTVMFDSDVDNRDLYWTVRAEAPGGTWTVPQHFRIEPHVPSLIVK